MFVLLHTIGDYTLKTFTFRCVSEGVSNGMRGLSRVEIPNPGGRDIFKRKFPTPVIDIQPSPGAIELKLVAILWYLKTKRPQMLGLLSDLQR